MASSGVPGRGGRSRAVIRLGARRAEQQRGQVRGGVGGIDTHAYDNMESRLQHATPRSIDATISTRVAD
eukprot:10743538-Prorocentrum_lima.AAC.1